MKEKDRWPLKIIAHRCYRKGPDPDIENTLAAFEDCLAVGYGVEIDIRRWPNGHFYISHEPVSLAPHPRQELIAEPYFAALAAASTAFVALNVKELGDEEALLDFIETSGVSDRVFLFDMELIETVAGQTAKKLKQINGSVRLAARISDRGETIDRALAIDEAEVIWADEMDELWLSKQDIDRLKNAGRSIYAISPEIHGFSHNAATRRWETFADWGIDGVCTDYPDALADYLDGRG